MATVTGETQDTLTSYTSRHSQLSTALDPSINRSRPPSVGTSGSMKELWAKLFRKLGPNKSLPEMIVIYERPNRKLKLRPKSHILESEYTKVLLEKNRKLVVDLNVPLARDGDEPWKMATVNLGRLGRPIRQLRREGKLNEVYVKGIAKAGPSTIDEVDGA